MEQKQNKHFIEVIRCFFFYSVSRMLSFSSKTETKSFGYKGERGGGRDKCLFRLCTYKMLKNIISRNFVYQSSKVRQLYTNLPRSNGGSGKVFNSREKAAEGVWARQMVRHFLFW